MFLPPSEACLDGRDKNWARQADPSRIAGRTKSLIVEDSGANTGGNPHFQKIKQYQFLSEAISECVWLCFLTGFAGKFGESCASSRHILRPRTPSLIA